MHCVVCFCARLGESDKPIDGKRIYVYIWKDTVPADKSSADRSSLESDVGAFKFETYDRLLQGIDKVQSTCRLG